MPPLKLVWYDNGLQPPKPAELEDDRELSAEGALLVGSEGKMLDGRIIPESKMQSYKFPPKTLPRSVGHHREWLEACKGGAPGGSSFDFAGPLTEVVLLGNVAMQAGKKLYWDPQNMQITNMPAANQFLRRTYRAGWEL